MPFRVSVTRSLLMLLCLSLIVPWGGVYTSVAAGQADPDASPVPVEIEQDVAPSPEIVIPDESVDPDLATGGGDVSDGLPPDTDAVDESADPDSATEEADDTEELTPETNEADGDTPPAAEGEDSGDESTPDVDVPDTGSNTTPLNQPSATEDSSVGALAVDESTVSVTVTMADGGSLPSGLNVAVYQLDSLNLVAMNIVPGGGTSATVELLNPVPYGDYRVFVTGAGYSEEQRITVGSETESYSAALERLPITVDLRLTTADGGDIPTGTKLTVLNRGNGLSVWSFVLPAPGTNGMGMGQLLGVGEYELLAEPDPSGRGRQVATTTTPFTVVNSELNHVEVPIVLAVQSVSTLTVTVTMADGGVIPPGITLSGSWDGHTDRIPVPAGATQVDVTFPNPIPYGDYELMVSTTSFSRRVVINLDSPVESFQTVVPDLFASATVILRTSDNGVIPAGTRWALKHGDTTVLSGVLDAPMISGTSFTIGPAYTNNYELTLTPPEDGVGRRFQEQSVSVVLYSAAPNTWSMDLQIQEALSAVTVTVVMADGGVIPYGLTMYPGWVVRGEGIPVPGGSTSVDIPILDPVPYGNYMITTLNASVGMPKAVTIDAPVKNVVVSLSRNEATSQITLNTSDGGVIPAGTQWAVMLDDITVLSGILTQPMASGSAFNVGPVYTDEYQVSITPPTDAGDRHFTPQSRTLMFAWHAANPYSFDLEVIPPTSTVTVSVAMSDAGNIPDGLQWSLLPVGSWDPIATGPVTAGSPSFSHDIPEQVPYGSYQLWITGNGYSSGQTISAQSATAGHNFTLTRLQGTLDLTLNTSDDGDVPVGTTFELMSGSTVVSSFTADASVTNGTVHPMGTFDFGVYELKVSPPTGGTGRQIVSQTIPVNMTNSWVTEYNIVANLEVVTPMSTVTVSVEMIDDGVIPMGLEWSLFPPGSWDPIATGPVTAGELFFEHDIPVQVPYGVYQLWITGNGYSSGQVINVQSDTFHHGFPLERLYGNLTITVTTNDGSDIPAGIIWEIRDANDAVLQSGTLTETLPSGGVLDVPNPLEFGVYTLHIGPPTDMLVPMALGDLPRDLLPYSITLNITNPWVSQYPVAAELQWAQSDVTFTVSMSDGGPLPNGLQWMIVVSGSWEPLASGPVTAGELTFAGQIPEPVPYGVYEIWISGNGYSSGQVINIQALTTHHDFVLDRLQADVTVTLDTSDDADIPAGTAWSIVDSAGNPVQSGVLTDALTDGSALPLTNPFAFDVYTLVVEADGYHPVTMELAVTNPWLTEMDFTLDLVSDRLPEPIPTEPSTPTPAPSPSPSPAPSPEPTPATPQPATPAPDSSADVTPAAPVTGLPQTGAGESGMAVVSLLLLAASLIALAAGFFLRERYRNSN